MPGALNVLGNSGCWTDKITNWRWVNICFWLALWQQLKRLGKLHTNSDPVCVLERAQWPQHGEMLDLMNRRHMTCILNACRYFNVCIVVFSKINITCDRTGKTISVCGKQHGPFGNQAHQWVEIALAGSHYEAIPPQNPVRHVEEKKTRAPRQPYQSGSLNRPTQVSKQEDKKQCLRDMDIYQRYAHELDEYKREKIKTVQDIVAKMESGDYKDETLAYNAIQNTLIDVLDIIKADNTKLMNCVRDAISSMTDDVTESVLLSIMDLICSETKKLRRYR
tara:strand:+ start:280 stop:1113 length:834 start_codon:yes stop_codon:yes gene_type:complete